MRTAQELDSGSIKSIAEVTIDVKPVFSKSRCTVGKPLRMLVLLPFASKRYARRLHFEGGTSLQEGLKCKGAPDTRKWDKRIFSLLLDLEGPFLCPWYYGEVVGWRK